MVRPGCTQCAQVARSAPRPRALRRIVACSGAVSWPSTGLAWPCHRPRRPYRGLVSRAPARIAGLLQVMIQNLYRNLGPCHLLYHNLDCVVSRHSYRPYLSAPLSRYNQLYRDMPQSNGPLITIQILYRDTTT